MASRLIIDGNAVYEIDEECMMKKKKQEEERRRQIEQRRNQRGKQ